MISWTAKREISTMVIGVEVAPKTIVEISRFAVQEIIE